MNHRGSFAILSVLILGGACATQPRVAVKPSIPITEAACVTAGGDWTHIGLPGMPKRCDLKAADAKMTCTDNSQCQGVCLAPESPAAGANANGECSPYVRNFGNLRIVTKGKVEELNVE
jgi:hypothetical protein